MKKVLLTVFMILCAFIFVSNINARELKIKSQTNKTLGEDYLEFFTYVKASNNSINGYNKYKDENSCSEDDDTCWAKLDVTNKGIATDHYDVIRFLISNAPMSNYLSSGNDKPVNEVPVVDENGREREGYNYWSWTTVNNYNVAYVDNYTDMIDLENVNKYLNENSADLVRITSKTDAQIRDEKIKYFEMNFTERDISYKVVENNGVKLVLYKYQINYLELMENIEIMFGEDWVTKYKLEDSDGKYVYISLITKMANTDYMDTAGKFYEEMFSPSKIGSISAIINDYMNTKANRDFATSQLAIENLAYIARDAYKTYVLKIVF